MTLAEQQAEVKSELRALGAAMLATPEGRLAERCAVWILTWLAKCLSGRTTT